MTRRVGSRVQPRPADLGYCSSNCDGPGGGPKFAAELSVRAVIGRRVATFVLGERAGGLSHPLIVSPG